jgi:hypothetical protein
MIVYPKSSYASANVSSARLLSNTSIKKEIEKRMKDHAMPANEALKRLSDMARALLFPFVRIDDDGQVYFNFADAEAKKHFHLIKKIKSKKYSYILGKRDEAIEVKEQWVEVELHDAQRALELLGKHYKLFTERIEQTEKKSFM